MDRRLGGLEAMQRPRGWRICALVGRNRLLRQSAASHPVPPGSGASGGAKRRNKAIAPYDPTTHTAGVSISRIARAHTTGQEEMKRLRHFDWKRALDHPPDAS